jgi:hypothetical protein
MKWFNRAMHIVKIGLTAMRWFDRAKADGVITLDEMTAGVTELLEVAGLADDVSIEIG